MSLDVVQERQQAHAYLDRLPPAQLSAVRSLLESMVDPLSAALANAPVDDEELTEEDAALQFDPSRQDQALQRDLLFQPLDFTFGDARHRVSFF